MKAFLKRAVVELKPNSVTDWIIIAVAVWFLFRAIFA